MPSTKSGERSSPAPSQLHECHSRRNSSNPISPRSNDDKRFGQALLQMHSRASQSEALTTFSDFVAPPGTGNRDAKGSVTSAGDIVQAGLSGIYARLKASVVAIHDGGKPASVDSDASTEDPSPTNRKPTVLLDTRPRLRTNLQDTATPKLVLAPTSRLQSPLATTFDLTRNDNDKSVSPVVASSTSTLSSVAKSTTMTPEMAPLTLSGPSTAAEPTTDYVSVTAIRDDSSIATFQPSDSHPGMEKQNFKIDPVDQVSQFTNEESGLHEQANNSVNDDLIDNQLAGERIEDSHIDDGYHVAAPPVAYMPNLAQVIDKSTRNLSGLPTAEAYDSIPAVERSPPPELTHQDQAPQVSFSGDPNVSASVMQKPLRLDVHHPDSYSSELSELSSMNTDKQDSVKATSPAVQPHSKTMWPAFAIDASTASRAGKHSESHMDHTPSFHVRRALLSHEFWMKDENAKDCFYCGKPFSTFRRKHHCRLCGQIFDNRCTSLLPGRMFGLQANVRICKACEKVLNGTGDDSSNLSDDGDVPAMPAPGSLGEKRHSADPEELYHTRTSHLVSIQYSEDPTKLRPPSIGIPASRRTDEHKHKSSVLEFDCQTKLARPSSSRSLKSISVRPRCPSHKRQSSRYRSHDAKPWHDGRAPFQRTTVDESQKPTLPAFHRDSIIDPDLAPFLSDEGSSEEERPSIFTTMSGHEQSASSEQGGTSLGGLLSALRKSRNKQKVVEEDGTSRDIDNISIKSARVGYLSRQSRKRSLSSSSLSYVRPSPRASKSTTLLENGTIIGYNEDNPSPRMGTPSLLKNDRSQMIRSSSMHGADAPPVELNKASLEHVRKLLKQLMQDARIAHVCNWERALVPVLLQCIDDVDPDVRRGDDFDIRSYVKIKKILGGRPGDTAYVSGVVFSKNVALKSMPRHITQPRLLIITFPLEYSRHGHHFMRLEPVIAQEGEYLRNLVNRILALSPQVLLVQGIVARIALQYLEEAEVAVISNVKPSIINAVSRCTQARRISSIDQLTGGYSHLSKCSSFDVKTYVHKGIKKSFIFLSGCYKALGCTIVLHGGERETLRMIKRITEFLCYVVYNLKLETCLMRDEFVLMPSYPIEGSMSSTKDSTQSSAKAGQSSVLNSDGNPAVAQSRLQEHSGREGNAAATGQADQRMVNPGGVRSADAVNGSIAASNFPEVDGVPVPTFYSNMIEKHGTKILSASPFVKFMQPYLLMKAREQEGLVMHYKRLLDLDIADEKSPDDTASSDEFALVKPEMIHGKNEGALKQFRDVLRALHHAEYDNAMHRYLIQKKQWEFLVANNSALFDPFAHQSIVILSGLICTPTSVPCDGPDIRVLEYYSNEHTASDPQASDCTLGQYVEDICHTAHLTCKANGCERKMLEHHRQYVHGNGQLSIFVQKYPSRIRGLQKTILMWSCCRVCGKETQVLPMSESTWKYSFGKYLEISFWNINLHARAGICPHDIHRDHVRYFGLNNLAMRVQYDPISLFEVRIPRMAITWKVDYDLRLKNDQFEKTEDRLNRFMCSVKERLRSIETGSVLPETSEACKAELGKLVKRANEEHTFLIRKLQQKYLTSRYYECIPLNRAIRAMQEKVAEWDATFAEFERNFFPSEKDIRKIAMGQFKKVFIDREEPISSLLPVEESEEIPLVEIIQADTDENDPAIVFSETKHDVDVNQDQVTARPQLGVSDVSPPSDANRDINPRQSPDAMPGLPPLPRPVLGLESADIRPLNLAISPSLEADGIQREEKASASLQGDGATATSRNKTLTDTPFVAVLPLSSTLSERIEQIRAAASSNNTHVPAFESKIPRPSEATSGLKAKNNTPPLHRAHTQPPMATNSAGRYTSPGPVIGLPGIIAGDTFEPPKKTEYTDSENGPSSNSRTDPGSNSQKTSKSLNQSMIPRSIKTYQLDTKVSLLAKHFEQLSKEFERERLRERRLRAESNRQSRAYPVASSRPVVEVYRDAYEGGHDQKGSEDTADISKAANSHTQHQTDARDNATFPKPEGPLRTADSAGIATGDNGVSPTPEPAPEAEGEESDADQPSSDDMLMSGTDGEEKLLDSDNLVDQTIELPKHQKVSFIKMLSRLWSERSSSGWPPLEYPLAPTDHVFTDSDIIVREDEPSSLIAFVLASQSYQAELQKIQRLGQGKRVGTEKEQLQSVPTNRNSHHFLIRGVDRHIDVAFQDGMARMSCKAWYAGSFDALRKECGVSERMVECLSRCFKWDSKGGKTKSTFLKTLDERFILKSLSAPEQAAFKDVAFDYFKYMAEILFEGAHSAIAKILGFYDVRIVNSLTGVEFERSLVVMENLFYDCNPVQKFDLKGSMRNRKVQSTGEQDEVLQDENMVEFVYEKPIFVRQHSKSLFSKCIRNDTAFLATRNVMDYSLMLGFDDERKELVVGLIDYIRTYTWDKKLESWIKDRGKNKPTITSPIDYRNRFRGSMSNYVLLAPDCWHQFRRGVALPGLSAETSSLKLEEGPSGGAEPPLGADIDAQNEEETPGGEQERESDVIPSMMEMNNDTPL